MPIRPRAKRLAALKDAHPVVIEIDDVQPLATALRPLGTGDATAVLPTVDTEDLATILFTSGSTGLSKGALSDHRAVVQAIFNYLAQVMTMVGIATQDGNPPEGQPSTLLNVPLFHVTAEIPVMLQSFAMGRKLVLMPKWDAEEAMRLIEKEGITYFVGVPLMSFEMLTHPNRTKYDLSTVADFAAGGAARPAEHVRRIAEEMGGGAPLIGYGLTETNAIGTGNWRSNYIAKPSSAGRPSLPLVDLAILDDAGKSVAQGQRGEIAIRSICNFREYWGRPDATAAAMTADGYFLTGDIGYLDEDGYVFIVDRKKDIIIRGGENISCQEVEAALYEHPDVAEAAVFGLADERLGEVPGAVVVPRDGTMLTADGPDRVSARAHRRVQGAADDLDHACPAAAAGDGEDRQGVDPQGLSGVGRGGLSAGNLGRAYSAPPPQPANRHSGLDPWSIVPRNRMRADARHDGCRDKPGMTEDCGSQYAQSNADSPDACTPRPPG